MGILQAVTIVVARRLPIQTHRGWGPKAHPIRSRMGRMGFSFLFELAFPRNGVVPGPPVRVPARDSACDPRQSRPFHIQELGIEAMRPHHWVSHMGLCARAAVSVLANSSGTVV